MSAKARRHKVTPKKDGKPIVSKAILSLVQSQERAEDFAHFQKPGSDTAEPSKATPNGTEQRDETLAALLGAIQGTEIAKRLRGEAPPGNGHPHAPVAVKPAKAEAATPTLDPQIDGSLPAASPTDTASPAGGLPDAPTAAKPAEIIADEAAFTPPVATPPHAASAELAPSNAAPPKQPAPDGAAKYKEFLTPWMRTIESADPAASPTGVASPASGLPDAPTAIEPVKIDAATSSLEPPVAAEPEPPPAMPSSPSDEPPNTVEPFSVIVAPPAPAPPQPADAAERAPSIISPSWWRSIKGGPLRASGLLRAGGLLRAPIPGVLGGEISRLWTKFGMATGYLDRVELQLEKWVENYFAPDPRNSPRLTNPPLVAYHWILEAQQGLKIADISSGGLHLLTDQHWPHGNIMSMTLQRTDIAKEEPDSWIAVDFLVIRWCEDGIAGAFLPSWTGVSYVDAGRAENCADKKTLERFVKRLFPAVQDQGSERLVL